MRNRNSTLLNITLTSIFLLLALICLVAPTAIYLLLVLVLLYEYFVFLGGFLNWLNIRKESIFEGTSSVRRILSSDAKFLLFSMILIFSLVINKTIETSSSTDTIFQKFVFNSPCFYMLFIEHDIKYININDIGCFACKLMFILYIIQSIHSLIIYEKLTGISFTKKPFILRKTSQLLNKIKSS